MTPVTTAQPQDQTADRRRIKRGMRPSFPALWHLRTLGVLRMRKGGPDAWNYDAWKQAAEAATAAPKRVVIIDTPVDHQHPNLQGAIDLGLMRDFSVTDAGFFPLRELSGDDAESRSALVARLDGDDSLIARKIRKETAADWVPSPVETTMRPGAHGTAVAGLIAARVQTTQLWDPAIIGDPEDSDRGAGLRPQRLPYCGVNPFCRVVPISISATPNPKMIAAALAYAVKLQPDVVVIADSWDFPGLDAITVKGGKPKGRKGQTPPAEALLSLVATFKTLCETAQVFCAAGNEDLDTPVYPAAFSVEDWGPWAVGACDEQGNDLNYSPDHAELLDKGYKMIKTLSTEVSRFDRDVTKIDPWQEVDPQLGLPDGDATFANKDIVTTDARGQAGYNPSPYDHLPSVQAIADGTDGYYDIASLYARFSGTSAACAIAGGLASLVPKAENDSPKDPPTAAQLTGLFDLQKAMHLFGKGH